MSKKSSNASGIVLLAKQPGITSFSSLFAVKKALETSKVGHTGTLDSFAQGLLIVCVGNMTRLASHITAFDKTYEAVIQFGKETDTLDPTGNVIETSELPALSDLKKSIQKFTGPLLQAPPSYSALWVNGTRASDLMRKGVQVELDKREINVFSSSLLEIKTEDGKNIIFNDDTPSKNEISSCLSDFSNIRVQFARVKFHVSKGTYIRSLARDIALDCKSRGHLIGLLRTEIGSFKLENSAGFSLLKKFTIDDAVKNLSEIKYEKDNTENENNSKPDKGKKLDDETFHFLMSEIKNKITDVTKEVASECGFQTAVIKDVYLSDFQNGKKLYTKMFLTEPDKEGKYAVFSEGQKFSGLFSFENRRFKYEYVISEK
ncbi:MAG: tRNA pseudouridine(55) synthase TruB [Treponema sp.]|nr:tRNA pseudouridine(55) synthase TruB [Candidatus Treponema merdequi]